MTAETDAMRLVPVEPDPKPTCGPKLSDCIQFPVVFGNAGFMVYRCKKCGSEEWL